MLNMFFYLQILLLHFYTDVSVLSQSFLFDQSFLAM